MRQVYNGIELLHYIRFIVDQVEFIQELAAIEDEPLLDDHLQKYYERIQIENE